MAESPQGGSISRTLVVPRKYQLDTGTVGTLRLRHILAEDGCIESQVALAKTLLNYSPCNLQERKENAQLAVHWLLKAAKTGHEEAFLLLKNCARSDVGINALNHLEVEKCLKFSEEEKISRRVASALFSAIMSDTEDLIDSNVFHKKVDNVLKEQMSTNTEDIPSSSTENTVTETSLRKQAHVSFIEVVNSVQSCLEGNVPLLSLKQVTGYNQFRKFLSVKYFCATWEVILRSAESFCEKFASLVLPFSALIFFLLLQITAFFSSFGDNTTLFIKKSMLVTVVFSSLLTMISFSCFVIHINFGGGNIKQWLHLIKIFEPNIRSEVVERKYLSKTTFAFVSFYFLSFIYVFLVPLTFLSTSFVDIGILSLAFMILVDRAICHQRYYVNISLMLNFFICLYKSNILQNLELVSLPFSFSGINYEVIENVYLHLGFISCLALPFVLPFLYIKMIWSQKNGWHLVLLPHLMSLVWMNLACSSLSGSTTTNQFFSFFSWLVVLFFSKYIGILLTLTLYVFLKTTLILELFQIEIMFVLLLFITVYALSSVAVRKLHISSESGFWCFVTCLTVMIMSYQTLKPQETYRNELSNAILPWEKYQSHCHPSSWYRSNTAEVQISCLLLKGRKIHMEGSVTDISVIEVHNNMEFVASFLPQVLQNMFICGFGVNYANCKTETGKIKKEHCELYESLNLKPCHLHNWNYYQYRLVLEVSSRTSPEVVIFTDHFSSDFVRNLKEGDSLYVIGILKSNIGSSSPTFSLQQAKCTTCPNNVSCLTPTIPPPDYRLSIKNVLWFYLAPFLKYELS